MDGGGHILSFVNKSDPQKRLVVKFYEPKLLNHKLWPQVLRLVNLCHQFVGEMVNLIEI